MKRKAIFKVYRFEVDHIREISQESVVRQSLNLREKGLVGIVIKKDILGEIVQKERRTKMDL